MAILYKNNASSTLSAAVAVGDTTFSVSSGASFPSPTGSDFFYATLIKVSTGDVEIVKVTSRSAGNFVVVRAQEGTTAIAFGANDRVELRITAGMLDQLKADATASYLPLTGGTVSGIITSSIAFGTVMSMGGQGDALGYNSSTGRGVYIKGTGNTYVYGGGIFYDGSTAQALLHAGNYGSYALPLGGGTLTGNLTSSAGSPFSFTALGNGTYNIGAFYVNSSLMSLEAPLASDAAGAAKIPLILTWRGGYPSVGGLKLTGGSSGELGGNAILHAGNYTSYSPTLTGTGASGSWGINITGSAPWSGITSKPSTLGGYGITDALQSLQYSFTTAGSGWYRVATTGSDGRGTYIVEMYTTGGNHNPSYMRIEAHCDWSNANIVGVYTDGGFPASAVRITRSASNSFLEINFSTTISGASFRINRAGFDSSVYGYSGALPGGGDTVWASINVTARINTPSINAGSLAGPIALSSGYTIGMGDWGLRNTTPYGWIQFGPANNSWAHIYASLPFYFNQELYVNNSQVLHNGNYTGFTGHLRALGGNDGMDFNTTSYNSMYYAYIANSANKPSGYGYPYGTILTFDPGQGGGGRAQFYISHAGNDLIFRGGWNANGSWQTWNRVLTDQNYTNWAPSLTGSGASGSWSINSATATRTNGVSGYAHAGTGMYAFYNWGGSNGGAGAPSDSTYTVGISVGSHPSDQAYGFQIGRQMWNDGIWVRGYDSGWRSWYRVLDSSNYNSYSPTLTGGNASGTWGISISGSLTASAPQLAAATEANSIYISAPSYTTDTPVKLLNFDWYGNNWAIGNIRSGATPSNGFGVYFQGSERARWSSNGYGYQVGTASSYDNPGGWNANIVAAGVYHARFRIKATSYNSSGDRETYLWLDNTVSPATGMYSSAPTFNFNGSISTVQVAGQTVLHSGNYTNYALSASGGSFTGYFYNYSTTTAPIYAGNWPSSNYWGIGGTGTNHQVRIGEQVNGAWTSQSSDISLLIGSNTALHSGNYTSYALQQSVWRRRGSSYGHAAYGLGRNIGRDTSTNCADFDYGNCNTYLYEDNSSYFDMYYGQRACYNCNCNCDCCC